MRWIGQNIWDLVSRFRDDIYLEGVETGTIASGGNLGLDSNNKVVKANITSSSGDIESVKIVTDSGAVAPALASSGDANFSLVGTSGVGVTNVDNTITVTSVPGEIDHDSLSNFVAAEHYDWSSDNSGTATIHTNNITDLHGAGVSGSAHQILQDRGNGTVTSSQTFTYDGNDITATSINEGHPVLTLKTTHTTKTKSAELQFLKDAADTEDGENLGIITFYGENDAGTPENIKFGHIKGSIQDATDGQEGGKIALAVATHDGEMRNGLIINDGNAEDEIDVTIGDTATSLTIISGTLTMGSTAFVDNSGVIQVATQGTIDHDSLANFVANEHIDWTTDQGSTNIHTGNYTNTTYSEATSSDEGLMSTAHHDKLDGIETGADVTDATNVAAAGALMDSELTDLAGVKGMTVANKANVASPTFTGTPAAPTAGAGTNTTQIATTAHVKASIDARYADSAMAFNGQATMLSSGNWVMPGKPGVEHHTWNLDSGVNTETNDSTAATIDRRWGHMGIRVPFACVISGLSCGLQNSGGNRQVTIGLFCSRAADSNLPDWGTTNSHSPKLQIHADAISEGTNYTNKPSRAEITGQSVAMAAGDIFYPAIKLTGVTSGGSTDNVYASITVHIKTLIS